MPNENEIVVPEEPMETTEPTLSEVLEAMQPTEEEQQITATLQEQQMNAYGVIIEYVPKLYGSMLFLIGFAFFAFIYKVFKNNIMSHIS